MAVIFLYIIKLVGYPGNGLSFGSKPDQRHKQTNTYPFMKEEQVLREGVPFHCLQKAVIICDGELGGSNFLKKPAPIHTQ